MMGLMEGKQFIFAYAFSISLFCILFVLNKICFAALASVVCPWMKMYAHNFYLEYYV
jgi:hypothetical protein